MVATRLMTVDLSSGEVNSVMDASLTVGSTFKTPWKDSLKLRESEIATQRFSGDRDRSSLVALDLSSIGWEEPAGKESRTQNAPNKPPAALDKRSLMPRWRERVEVLLAELNPTLLSRAAVDMVSPVHVDFRYPQGVFDRQLQHIMLTLRTELEEGCPAGRLFGESLATTLAIHLVRRYAVLPTTMAKYRGGLPLRRLRIVIDYMDAHLGDEIRLTQLADLARMSQFHFGHLFKQSVGMSPYQFFLRQRITKAKGLLSDGRLSLAEISILVGFSSQTHFTTVFRRLVGTTPLAYRKDR